MNTTAPAVTSPTNPDAVHGLHTCDTAVLDGTPRPLAEVYCPACPDRQRYTVPAQRIEADLRIAR